MELEAIFSFVLRNTAGLVLDHCYKVNNVGELGHINLLIFF